MKTKKNFLKKLTAVALGFVMTLGVGAAGYAASASETRAADTYSRLESIASIDEDAKYVLGIDGTGFHYEGTSSWGKTALPSSQTPLYYNLKKASDESSFKASTSINGDTYYLTVPTSNTFSMNTSSSASNSDLIIGTTTGVADKNYAVTNKGTTGRHLRINGASGLRSYANSTGTTAFFYKVVPSEVKVSSLTFDSTTGLSTKSLEIMSNDVSAQTINVYINPSNATNQKIDISCDNTNVALVSASQITASSGHATFTITGKGATSGTQTITLKANGDQSKTATLTLTAKNAASPSIELSGTKTTIWSNNSETTTLTATAKNFTPSGSYTWTSTNTSVATVSGGVVTAKSSGTTNITASVDGYTSNAVAITVKTADLSLDKTELTLKAEKSEIVTATASDFDGAATISATSADSSVATCSVSGNEITITAGSTGGVSTTVTITATKNGISVSKNIVVTISAGFRLEKVTSKPTTDTEVYLILKNNGSDYYAYINGTTLKLTDNEDNADIFIFKSDGTICSKTSSQYIYIKSSGTTVGIGNNGDDLTAHMDTDGHEGLLRKSGDRWLGSQGTTEVKQYSITNLGTSGYCDLYAYKLIASTPSARVIGDSISDYKGKIDTTTSTVLVENTTATGISFTYKDNGADTASSTSTVVDVSATVTSTGYSLSITLKSVGTSIICISVTTAAKTFSDLTISVIVNAKPGSITSSFSTSGVNFVNKDSTSQSGYRSITPELFDTDGNKMTSTPASDVFDFAVTGNDHVHVSDGGRVYGDGTASSDTVTITVSSKEIPTVSQSYTVKAIADYITGTWNVGGSLTKSSYTAGEEFNPADLAITAKYFFAGIQTVPYSDLLFTTSNQGVGKRNPYSFNNYDALGENATTIYVYYGDKNEPVGSVGNITVTPTDIPMTGLAFKLAEDGEEVEDTEMTRGDELTLIPVFKPSNTSDSKTLSWTVEQDGSGISVDQTGKITVAADATVGNVGIITASTTFEDKEQITADFMVTVLREEQKVRVIDEAEESYDLIDSISDGDEIVFVQWDKMLELNGAISNNRGDSTAYGDDDDEPSEVSPNGVYTFIVEESDGKYAFYHENEDKSKTYLNHNGKNNQMKYSSTENYFDVDFDDNFDILLKFNDGSDNRTFVANVSLTTGNNLFAFYKDTSIYTTSGELSDTYGYVSAYKKTGGTQEYDAIVSDDLFEAVVDASQYLNDDWELVELSLSDIIDAGGEDLTILQHGVNLSTGNEVQKFLYNYDNLVVNSGEEDFLNRFAKHTVTFDSDGGTSIDPVTVVEGAKVTKPEDPTKTGYEFDKWYYENDEFDFNTPIMADITLTANWSEKSYNVSFSGSNVTFTGDATCKYGASYSATLSASTGYSLPSSLTVTAGGSPFSGYLYNSSTGAFSITSMPANDISISGNATASSYTISYNLDGGTALGTNPTSYTIESETITLFGASKTGYIFDGWYDSNNVKVTQIVKGSTGNISLTAKYTAETYNVSFTGEHVSSNGAATCEFGKPYSATFTADDSYVLPGSITVKLNGEDYLDYDYSSVDGSFSIASMPAGNISISVTAQQGAYQITYKEVDGTVISEPQLVKEYEFGIGATLVDAQDRTGYKFVGWYSEPELVNKVESIAPTEKGNKIFYAKWAFAAQDALDSVQTSIGMSYTYQKDANAPIVSSSNPPTKAETRGADTYHYEKVTSDKFVTGDYLIICEDEKMVFSSLSDAKNNCTSVTISTDGTIAYSSTLESYSFHFDLSKKQISKGTSYINGGTTDANKLNITTSEVSHNSISIDTDGNAQIVSTSGNVLRCNHNNGDPWFRYFKSSTYTGQKAVQLYQKVSDKKAVTSIEIVGTPTKTTYNVGEAYSAAGLSVKATYEGGSQEIVTATITPSKQYAAEGDTSVTFSATYEEKTASLPVNVTVNSVYSNVSFKFNFKNTGMDALVSEYGDAFDDIGLVVEYAGRTRYFSFIPDDKGNYYIYEDGEDPTTFKMKDGGVFTMSLGDVINNLDRAATEFTVKAYIRDGENYYYSSNSTTYSVMSWISYYHSKSDYKDATEDLYNIFFPNAQ